MTDAPGPELVPGHHIRPATWDDLSGIVETMRAVDLHDWGAEVGEENDIRRDWGLPSFDLERDTVVAVGDRGEIVAYAVDLKEGDAPEVFSIGFVHPASRGRGIGAVLLEWVEARAREILARRDGLVRGLAAPNDADGRLFTLRGWVFARAMETMIASLDDEPPEVRVRDVEIRPFRSGEEGAVHAVLMSAFAGHFGFTEVSLEEWRGAYLASPRADTGLWFVAEGDGVVVGAAIGVVRLGIGWVAEVGVLDKWRRRGIGAALTARLMYEFRGRGESKVGLNVDPLNETGAKRLYERLGFTRDRRIDFYELKI